MKATRKQTVAARSVGIIRTPNQPTYKRLSVEVTQEQNCSQVLAPWRREIVEAIVLKKGYLKVRGNEQVISISLPPSSRDIKAFKVEPGGTVFKELNVS